MSDDLARPNGVPEAEYRRILRDTPGAKDWGWRVMRRDPEVYVRFEMPAGGREAFLATTRCPSTLEHVTQPPQSQTSTQAVPGPDDPPSWWDPDRFDELDSTSADPDTGPGQHIMFGKSENSDDVVYVYVFYI